MDETAGTALSPLSVCFKHVIGQSQRLSALGILDEETLTSCLLGGVAASIPLISHLRSAEGSGNAGRCFWGPYRKTASGDPVRTESGSGADFALLLADDPSSLRLAIFQAKKGVTRRRVKEDGKGEQWVLDVHRRPPEPEDGPWREAQMVRLARMGRALADMVANGQEEPLNLGAGTSKQPLPEITDLHWIHYLAYTDMTPNCLALSGLDQALIKEDDDSGGVNYVSLDDAEPFFDLLQRGLNPVPTQGWLPISLEVAKSCLPDLVEMVPLFVGDSSGAVAAALGLDPDADFAAAPESSSELTLEALSKRLIAMDEPKALRPGRRR